MQELSSTSLLLVLIFLSPFTNAALQFSLRNYCFGPPYGDMSASQYVKTIGTETLNWPGFNNDKITIASKLTVKVYGMKRQIIHDSHESLIPLTGWLHVVVSQHPDEKSEIDRLAINARGYMSKGFVPKSPGWVSGVGSFRPGVQRCVDDPLDSDKLHTAYDSDLEFFPCGGVAAFEPTMAGGFVQAIKSGKAHQFHLNYRFSQTVLNFYSKLSFRVHGFIGAELIGLGESDTIIFNNSLVDGGADPAPDPNVPYYCHIDLPDEEHFPGISNVERTHISVDDPLDDYSCLPPLGSNLLFSGRCQNKMSPTGDALSRMDGSFQRPQMAPDESDLDPAYLNSLKDFQDELKEVSKIIKIRCATGQTDVFECPKLPPRPVTEKPHLMEHLNETLASKLKSGHHKLMKHDNHTVNEKKLSVRFGEPIVKGVNSVIWDARAIHGVFMAILTFLALPVDFITTRYFKETWMGKTILRNHYWYFFHHFWVGISFILYLAGMVRLIKTRNFLGTSLSSAGKAHTACGYISLSLFTLMMLFGGFRPFTRSVRTLCISLHFLFGMLIYLLNLTAVLTSVLIPASPSGTGGKWKINAIFALISLRVILDILTHVVLSISLCKSDKLLQLERKRFYFPAPIPVVNDRSFVDLPGSTLRIFVLRVYAVASFCITLGVCSTIIITDLTTVPGYGPLSCTHASEVKWLKTLASDCL